MELFGNSAVSRSKECRWMELFGTNWNFLSPKVPYNGIFHQKFHHWNFPGSFELLEPFGNLVCQSLAYMEFLAFNLCWRLSHFYAGDRGPMLEIGHFTVFLLNNTVFQLFISYLRLPEIRKPKKDNIKDKNYIFFKVYLLPPFSWNLVDPIATGHCGSQINHKPVCECTRVNKLVDWSLTSCLGTCAPYLWCFHCRKLSNMVRRLRGQQKIRQKSTGGWF